MTLKRQMRVNTAMPANAAMPADTAASIFPASCETEMHIRRYGREIALCKSKLLYLETNMQA